MSWWYAVPTIAVAATIIFVPGIILGWALNLKGLVLAAASAPLSIGLFSAMTVLLPLLRVPWSLWTVALALSVGLCAATVRIIRLGRARSRGFRAVFRLNPRNIKPYFAQIVIVLLSVVLVGRGLIGAFGEPENFSQTFDNIFHLNAVRYILDNGSASPFALGNMTGGGFYPSSWHALVALVVEGSGAAIPVAVNAVNLVIGAVVWPLGCLYLCRLLAGSRKGVGLITAVLAASFGAFPLLMVDFGVLYPNFLGIALLPFAWAAALQVLGIGERQSHPWKSILSVLIISLPGLALAHPSSVMVLIALLLPRALWLLVKKTRFEFARFSRHRAPAFWYLSLLVGVVILVLIFWIKIRPSEQAAFWPPVESPLRALADVFLSAPLGRPASVVVAVLLIIGLISILLRRKQLWLIGSFLLVGILFVAAASFRDGRLRNFISGIWYNDPPRLAAILPLVVLPVALFGALELGALITGLWSRIQKSRRVPSGIVILCACLAFGLFAIGSQIGNVQAAIQSASGKYRISDNAPLISSDELTLLQRLPNIVPKDSKVIGNPWTGASLVYAISNRVPVQFHILGVVSEEANLLYSSLNNANIDPAVCRGLRSLHVGYALDFGNREVNDGEGKQLSFTGLKDLVKSGVAQIVDQSGDAKLLRITACGELNF